MQGNLSEFEALGSRLGFRLIQETPERIVLAWQGARFPAFLCLGIALALLSISVPILEALRQRGFQGPAASLWYFPLMNLVLLGISFYLLSLKRTIVVDAKAKTIVLAKRTLLRRSQLRLNWDEVKALRLGTDQVYSGFAIAGSSAAETYPVPSLRLVLKSGGTILLDRSGMKKLESLAERLGSYLNKDVVTQQPASHS
ncbi:MAG: hypothetical protein A3F90_10355 [Deltaproteobacteria bacterium RIFCSPLOWO2_12_FULL_60_19]|nr:MAG: hypothetical protein A3F90_10355 [Deltaproteobacteria bacterium RIFCSPLOWO2_12_FULL_60_19]